MACKTDEIFNKSDVIIYTDSQNFNNFLSLVGL